MSEEQSMHRSENEISLVKEMATSIVYTDDMSLEHQTEVTLKIIEELYNA
jgi:hypothetical protein